MLEAGVEVVLQAKCKYDLEVGVVNMRVDSEQSFEDGLDHRQKGLGEGHA